MTFYWVDGLLQKKFYKEDNIKLRKIRFGNLNKVVRLYEEIDEFENTTVDNIKSSLKTGRGYCVEREGKVVSMAKTTSENKSNAMIIGVGTHPKYRNRSYATKCVVKICNELLQEKKIPCLEKIVFFSQIIFYITNL